MKNILVQLLPKLSTSWAVCERALFVRSALLTAMLTSTLAQAQPTVRVGNFNPTTHGLHFFNSFPEIPYFTITFPPGVEVPIGNAANGMCGGMAFTVRDYYESGFLLPTQREAPTNGPLFSYLSTRLFDSFDLPNGPVMYLNLMNPDLPDHETDASRLGLAPHGRAWVMIIEQWPLIKSQIDAGILSPMALIRIKSHDPFDMGHNHQVLAYGYSLSGPNVQIYVYDPNHPDDDNVYIEFSTADPQHTTEVLYRTRVFDPAEIMYCFFFTSYGYSTPPPGAAHVNGVSPCLFPNGDPDCGLLPGGPFHAVSQGVQAAPDGGIVMIRVGPYLENLTINKPVTIRAWGGPVIIGH